MTSPVAKLDPNALRCLDGGVPPQGLGSDLHRLLDLPDAAQKEFWRVLGAYLEPELDDRAQAAILAYCSKHDVSPDQIAPAVKATRFLLQGAAKCNASAEAFVADLQLLTDDEDAGRDLATLLLPWYEDFLPKMRRAAVDETLLGHGKLVTKSSWRLEHITSSDLVDGVATSVAMLTFTYREGEQVNRITLQLLPDQVDALRRATERMLG